jgi:hypothetical protein
MPFDARQPRFLFSVRPTARVKLFIGQLGGPQPCDTLRYLGARSSAICLHLAEIPC